MQYDDHCQIGGVLRGYRGKELNKMVKSRKKREKLLDIGF